MLHIEIVKTLEQLLSKYKMVTVDMLLHALPPETNHNDIDQEIRQGNIVVGPDGGLHFPLDAVALAKVGAEVLGGNAGGRADLASGGGPLGFKAQLALDAIMAAIDEQWAHDRKLHLDSQDN